MSIGDRVRAERARLGLTQRELAAQARVSPGQVGHIEAGTRTNLETGTLAPIAGALGVSVDWLLSGEGPRERRLEQTVEHAPRYATLREVIEQYPDRWSDAAIAAAEQRALKADTDPGASWWEEQLDRLHHAIRLAELPMNAIAPKVPQRERPSAAAQRPDALGRPRKPASEE